MNKIPREFKSIHATALCGKHTGHRFRITKGVNGYIAEDLDDGTVWSTFVSHLRNENFFRITLIEKVNA